jgi:hypothetical protein
MAFYRTEDGRGTVHINFGRRAGPAPCRGPLLTTDDAKLGAHCGRISVALCDAPVGEALDGTPLTCDMPMCEHHRTQVGPNLDHCPRHAKQLPLPEVNR